MQQFRAWRTIWGAANFVLDDVDISSILRGMLNQEQLAEIGRKLGVTNEARQKWWQRGQVPHRWRLAVLQEAMKCGIQANYDELGRLRRKRAA